MGVESLEIVNDAIIDKYGCSQNFMVLHKRFTHHFKSDNMNIKIRNIEMIFPTDYTII